MWREHWSRPILTSTLSFSHALFHCSLDARRISMLLAAFAMQISAEREREGRGGENRDVPASGCNYHYNRVHLKRRRSRLRCSSVSLFNFLWVCVTTSVL